MSSAFRISNTLTGATCGIRHLWLESGVTPADRVHAERVGRSDGNAVPVVVLTEGGWEGPNESSRDQGIDLLDRYISENFQSVARFGEYRILERKPDSSGAFAPESAS